MQRELTDGEHFGASCTAVFGSMQDADEALRAATWQLAREDDLTVFPMIPGATYLGQPVRGIKTVAANNTPAVVLYFAEVHGKTVLLGVARSVDDADDAETA